LTRLGGYGLPGIGSMVSSAERNFIWGGDAAKGHVMYDNAVISGTTRDAGNTPTTVLRSGLLLGKITSTGELAEWNADLSDGTEELAGILDPELRATDFDANDADRYCRVVIKAPVKAAQLLIEGAAFIGHANEYIARSQMVAAGFTFDDDVFGYKAGIGATQRYSQVTGTTDTLTPAENGRTLFYSNAASVTVTLPTIQPGLYYDLIRTADEEFIVVSAEGDNVIVGNDLSADGVTFTTAGQQIGARVRAMTIYVGTTLKWVFELPTPPFGTGFTGGFAYSIQT
jgi:hypothetical protein